MMRRAWRRWRSLPRGDRLVLLQAWWLLLVADLGLRRARYPAVRAVLARWPVVAPAGSGPEDPARLAERCARLIRLAARIHLTPMSCLRRALALERLLVAWGVRTALCFGARSDGGQMEAHAWLEMSGVPVVEGGDVRGRYAVLRAGSAPGMRTGE